MVRRTSGHYSDEASPVKGAVREKYTRIDERTCNDPKKIPAHRGGDGDWYERGTNHRVEKGRIRRDFEAEAWFLDVDSLDALLKLADKNGEVIVGWCSNNSSIRQLEIYDDYRE